MDGGPPYARIAAELRGQIERGELLPGQRVPSTREITARWGVAMATATRVLATLRQEGLVHPKPGVGTVVSVHPAAPPRQAPAAIRPPAGHPPAEPLPPGPPPDRPAADPARLAPGSVRPTADRGPGGAERIVAAAITVADAEGLAALSMRRVAAELGAAPMSLYRHVADKDDLVLQMMNTVFARSHLPDPPDGWRARLELAARTLWAMFGEHPWLASALSLTRPQALPADAALHRVGADRAGRSRAGPGRDVHRLPTLINYVRGIAVNLESEAEAEAVSGLNSEEWLDTQEPQLRSILAPGQFPMFEQLISQEYDFSLDRIFEFGLQRLLDGLATLIADPAIARRPPAPHSGRYGRRTDLQPGAGAAHPRAGTLRARDDRGGAGPRPDGPRGLRRRRPAVLHPDAVHPVRAGGLHPRVDREPGRAHAGPRVPACPDRDPAGRDRAGPLGVRAQRQLRVRGGAGPVPPGRGPGRAAGRVRGLHREAAAGPLGRGAQAEPQRAERHRLLACASRKRRSRRAPAARTTTIPPTPSSTSGPAPSLFITSYGAPPAPACATASESRTASPA